METQGDNIREDDEDGGHPMYYLTAFLTDKIIPKFQSYFKIMKNASIYNNVCQQVSPFIKNYMNFYPLNHTQLCYSNTTN